MKLVITEKPSVAKTIANVIGATKRESDYLEGNGYLPYASGNAGLSFLKKYISELSDKKTAVFAVGHLHMTKTYFAS